MNPTTQPGTDAGVAIQQGLAGLFLTSVDIVFNLIVLVFGQVMTQVFTAIFTGLASLFQSQ